MTKAEKPRWWPILISAGSLIVALLGILADTTSLVTNEVARDVLSRAYPYAIVTSTVLFAFFAGRYWMQARALSTDLQVAIDSLEQLRVDSEANLTKRETELREQLESRRGLEIALLRRLVRVVGSNASISALPAVSESRIQSLFDELVGALPPYFENHHKFSVARPNPDGSFSLLASRGMDPTAISSIEKRASWTTGRSFYASLLTDPTRAEWRIYSTSDTAYVDTRAAGDSASRPTSSSRHFLLALRDEDLYSKLPKHTLALVSVGIPKRLDALTEAQGLELFRSVLPVAKAIEVLLLAELRAWHGVASTSYVRTRRTDDDGE